MFITYFLNTVTNNPEVIEWHKMSKVKMRIKFENITIDDILKVDKHVNILCKTTGFQINILCRFKGRPYTTPLQQQC